MSERRKMSRTQRDVSNEWRPLKKAFIQYRDNATLIVIPGPIDPIYLATVITHVGGAYHIPSVDVTVTLAEAMQVAEKKANEFDEREMKGGA